MGSTASPKAELPILLFDDEQAWERWLEHHHGTAPGVWLQLAKKNSRLRSVSYAAALDVALCYGWIDGQKRSHDAESWLQKFTPRGAKSIWSKINVEKVRALSEAGRVRPAGLLAIERAKASGRWDAAYESQSNARVPEDFQSALDSSPEAKAFFASLNGANRYAMLFRIQSAKRPDTRSKRIEKFVGMLTRGEKIYP